MSSNYVKNLAGFKLSEDQMRNVAAPGGELFTHIFIKSVQMGAFVGCLMVAPAFRAIKGPRTLSAISASALRGGIIGSGVGLCVGPILAYSQTYNKDEDGRLDRAFRLRLNRNQVRVDRAWISGSVIGPCVAAAMGAPLQTGFVVGGVGGILVMAMYNMTIGGKKD